MNRKHEVGKIELLKDKNETWNTSALATFYTVLNRELD